ncbi:rho GTPase-activating protein 12-like isoform X2 [Acanthaster planci]|uniref:Rho GTPase-activating protein 12-like isoform X2 n=1 Tax=Acanthaster planci TaxID=133434 RepID=A0A8B7Z2M0_ACAPL|nr:rho GTPase-activating protein 12-like isoform X2 [Acanthaster planci]
MSSVFLHHLFVAVFAEQPFQDSTRTLRILLLLIILHEHSIEGISLSSCVAVLLRKKYCSFTSVSMEQPVTQMVQAKYEYEYMSGSGLPAKMLPGDLFTLLRKSNSDWWYVKREGEKKPVYLPATYLEIQPDNVVTGLGNRTAQRSSTLIPHAYMDSASEQTQPVPGNVAASQIRHNNMVSEISDRLRNRIVIPKPDYDNSQDPVPRPRPTQLNVRDGNSRQGIHKVATPIGGAMSPMTDSELSSHSEQSSVNSPEYFPPPPNESELRSHILNSNVHVAHSLSSSQLMPSAGDEWEMHRDERGRKYYYNNRTNETSWDPPSSVQKKRSSSVSPRTRKKNEASLQSLPPGWREEKTPSGGDVFINDQFKEKWYKSQNEHGETYYYSGDREETGWSLPTFTGWDSKLSRAADINFLMNVHRRHSEIEVGDIHPETASSEKEGYLQRARPGEATRKVKWQQVYTAVTGSRLAFFKDHKKSGTPVMLLELWGSQVVLHSEKQSKYLKKSYIELKTSLDKEYWLMADTEEETHLWYAAINGAVRSLPPTSQHSLRRQNSADDTQSPSSDGPSLRPTSPLPAQRPTSPKPRPENLVEISSKSRQDKKKIKNKLKSFITKRPTMEALQKQGIIKEEDVFGRHIQALCEQQRTLVPKFVTDCIALIEKSGLHMDGIYRVSGNLSLIQKLRFLVDQEKPVDFSASPWKEDIHVIAGALKLYFRELPEPLVTFDGYDGFMEAMRKPDRKSKLKAFQDVINSLPRVNQETMKVLFRHLNNVVAHKDKNRMLPQNLAIVFGPTLMWPKKESFNVALSMVYQNQCIEFIINEHQNFWK